MVDLSAIKERCQQVHDELGMAQRWGDANQALGGTCYASIQDFLGSEVGSHMYTVMHGDGVPLGLAELVSEEAQREAQKAYTRPWNKFEGTARTRDWIEFLMSDDSPWKALHPYILEKDLDYINTAGFIWRVAGLPKRLFYNFIMAARWPWEVPQAFGTYERLRTGMDRKLAVFVANNFALAKGATSIDGPWTVQYPWSYLEGIGLEGAEKFLSGEPTQISEAFSPNVFPLWSDGRTDESENVLDALAADGNLSLATIVATIEAFRKGGACAVKAA